jgi:hypothetical protein
MAEFLEIYVSSFWAWAGISLGISWVGNWIFKFYNRWMRSRNIAAQGWPKARFMDADGDIVHPEKEGRDQFKP